ncbi:Peroxisomal membrane signal receptor PTS1 [Thoreauomyces humboldtii]|nr:Peroxisomal membrane signal receptor PTS1 [Thoreauomyces humboldtii]
MSAFKTLVGSTADCSGGNSISSFVKQLDRNNSIQQDLSRPGPSQAGEQFAPRGRIAELDARGFVDEFLEARQPDGRQRFRDDGGRSLNGGGAGSMVGLEEVLHRQGLDGIRTGQDWTSDFRSFQYAPGNDVNTDFEAAFQAASRPGTDWSREFAGAAIAPHLEREAFEQAFAQHRDQDLEQAFSREFAAVQDTLFTGKGKEPATASQDQLGGGEQKLEWEEEFAKNFAADPDFDRLGDMFNDFDIDAASTTKDWEEDYGDFAYDEPDGSNVVSDPVTAPCAPYVFETENPYVGHPDPLAEGARLLEQGESLSDAALALEAAVQRNPDDSQAWSLLGAAQAENEKEGPAIAALQRSVQIDPRNLSALMALAVSYTNESQEREAYASLRRWVTTQYPSLPTPPGDLSHLPTTVHHEQVTALFLDAAREGPSAASAVPVSTPIDPSVQTGLGVLFYNSGDHAKAIDCFTAALSSSPDDHLLWNRLGATLANSGRSEEAIDAYYKALELKPRFVRARYNLGVSCINVGCYREAVEHLLGALSMHRDGEEKASANLWETLKRGFILVSVRKSVLCHSVPCEMMPNLVFRIRRWIDEILLTSLTWAKM